MRILILNNYPMDRVLREIELSETPRHVMFAVDSLITNGHTVIFVPYPAFGFWSYIQRILQLLRIPADLGDLQQQFIALSLANTADIVYAPCGTQTHLIQYLKAFGFFHLPIVTLVHHPFPNGRLDFLRYWQRRLYVKGVSVLATLSHRVSHQMRSYDAQHNQTITLQWGTDSHFYGEYQPPGSGVIAVGRTGRDFLTFARGLVASISSGTIIGLEGNFTDPIYHANHALKLIQACDQQPAPGEEKGWIKYPNLCAQMRQHSAIAIPLFEQDSLVGLTSVMDALGLGRALLMTRNSYIDIDIESEGIGFWIDSGDVDQWTNRLNWVKDNPHEVRAMGERAYLLGLGRYNYMNFSSKMTDIIESLC